MKFKTIICLLLLSTGVYLGVFVNYDSTLLKVLGSISAAFIVSTGFYVWRSKFDFALISPQVEKTEFKASTEEGKKMFKGESPVFSIEAYLNKESGLIINVKKSQILSTEQVKDIIKQVNASLESLDDK